MIYVPNPYGRENILRPRCWLGTDFYPSVPIIMSIHSTLITILFLSRLCLCSLFWELQQATRQKRRKRSRTYDFLVFLDLLTDINMEECVSGAAADAFVIFLLQVNYNSQRRSGLKF